MSASVPPQELPPFLAGPLPDGIRHGFFTRAGGVSQGPYASLNCSLNSGDDPAALAANRTRVAAAMGVAPDRLLGLTQVHGIECVQVDRPWLPGAGPRADAMATRQPGLALGIITADCAPVLLADRQRGVAAAVHAGWRGAAAGVLEATVQAMLELGADRTSIAAVVGPCIGASSYEVGKDLRDTAIAAGSGVPGLRADTFFSAGRRPGHLQFDLPGYCVSRLLACGIGAAAWLGCDTLPDTDRFFSHRRRTLAGGGAIGHQISVIVSGAPA